MHNQSLLICNYNFATVKILEHALKEKKSHESGNLANKESELHEINHKMPTKSGLENRIKQLIGMIEELEKEDYLLD